LPCILPESVYVFNILQIFLDNPFYHFSKIFDNNCSIPCLYFQNFHTFIWYHEFSNHQQA